MDLEEAAAGPLANKRHLTGTPASQQLVKGMAELTDAQRAAMVQTLGGISAGGAGRARGGNQLLRLRRYPSGLAAQRRPVAPPAGASTAAASTTSHSVTGWPGCGTQTRRRGRQRPAVARVQRAGGAPTSDPRRPPRAPQARVQ